MEIFDMWDSHSCACTCRVMAICCAGLGSCLYVSASGGSSSSDMSCAISASVLTLNVPVLLITMGMILISALRVLCVCRACFSGSYIVYMWSMMSVMLPSVEYLHSISCSCLLPLYVGSSLSFPSGPIVYPIARMMSGLWWVGLYCAGRMYSGMMWGVSALICLSS